MMKAKLIRTYQPAYNNINNINYRYTVVYGTFQSYAYIGIASAENVLIHVKECINSC